MTKSNKNRSPQRDYNDSEKHSCKSVLIQAALHIILVQLQACQHSQTSQRTQHTLLLTSREFTSPQSFQLWSIYMVHKYQKIISQNCHVNPNTAKYLAVQSYRCTDVGPLRIHHHRSNRDTIKLIPDLMDTTNQRHVIAHMCFTTNQKQQHTKTLCTCQ